MDSSGLRGSGPKKMDSSGPKGKRIAQDYKTQGLEGNNREDLLESGHENKLAQIHILKMSRVGLLKPRREIYPSIRGAHTTETTNKPIIC